MKLFFIPLVVLLALLGFLLLAPGTRQPQPQSRMGEQTQTLSLEVFSLPPLFAQDEADAANIVQSGKPILLTVWASWCAPCRVEHPILMELAQNEDLVLVGIAYKDAPDNARHFLNELGNPYAFTLLDESGAAMLHWGLLGVPESFLLDPEGELLLRHFGPLTQEAVDNEVLPEVGDFIAKQ